MKKPSADRYFCRINKVINMDGVSGWDWEVVTYNGHVILSSPRIYLCKALCKNIGKEYAKNYQMEWREEK